MADPTSPTLDVDDNADLFAGMKKKKKSKKVNFDEEAPVAADGGESTALPVEAALEGSEQTPADLDFSDLKKKKKKKSVRIADEDEDMEEVAPKPAKKTDALGNEVEDLEAPAVAAEKADDQAGDDEFADLKKMKKKKGSKKSTFDLEAFEKELAETEASEANNAEGDSAKATPVGSDGEEDDEPVEGEDPFAKEGEEGTLSKAEAAAEAKAWLKEGDRDYHYSELLGRFYSLLYATHPSLSSSGVKKKYTIPPPQMHREGNKRSIFANVVEICKKMHRQPEHVIQFLFAELGTSGSVDGKGMLVIKGRFQQKQMENVLRRYIVEYVTCKTCKSPDTLLTKDNRLFFMTCESCGSTRSVSAIKSGFQAQTGKRRAQRAAA